MNLKIIGPFTNKLKDKLINIHYKFVKNSKDANFVVISSGIETYFLNTAVGLAIEEAYNLEFNSGSPLVLKEDEFLKKNFPLSAQLSI